MNGGPMKRFSLAILALVVATGAQEIGRAHV